MTLLNTLMYTSQPTTVAILTVLETAVKTAKKSVSRIAPENAVTTVLSVQKTVVTTVTK